MFHTRRLHHETRTRRLPIRSGGQLGQVAGGVGLFAGVGCGHRLAGGACCWAEIAVATGNEALAAINERGRFDPGQRPTLG
jgi:hypothetical protein